LPGHHPVRIGFHAKAVRPDGNAGEQRKGKKMKIFEKTVENGTATTQYVLLSNSFFSISNSPAPGQYTGGEEDVPAGYFPVTHVEFLREPDWAKVRRRIEERLRHSDPRELWGIARVLGVKIE